MVNIEQKGRTKGDKEMSSFYFKTKKRMIAWICAITMVVAGLAVAPKTVVADEEAGTTAVDWSNITEWTRVGETDIYYSITNAIGMFNKVNVANSELFYFVTNRGGFTATITGPKTDDVVEKECAGAEIELRKSDFPTDGYYTIDTTGLDGLQIAVKRGGSSSGGGEVSAPKAPTNLEAHIGGANTFYTIAFAPVDGAKSYKFYLDGKYIEDIVNGGTVTIEKLGLKAGKTYKFGVSAVNAAGGESDITTIDVTAPGKEEGTTTPTPGTDERTGNIVQGKIWKAYTYAEDGKGLYEISSDATNYTLKDKNIGSTWWHIQTAIDGVTFYANTDYVCTFTLKADKPKEFTVDNRTSDGKIFVESEGKGWQKAEDGTYFYKYKGTFASTTKQDLNVRIALGYHNGKDKKTDSNYSVNDIATFKMSNFQIVKASEYKDVTYTVSIDGKEEAYEKGDSISVPTEGQGYYEVTKKEAYAPGTVLTVNENMTLKSIKLNVTMTPGASIRLAAPTGLRFQTTVKSGNGIAVGDILDLKTGTVTTGTLITTLDLYKTHKNKLTKDSDYTFLDIANDGWFNNGTSTETGKFCGSIIKIQKENYGREFIAVGYATINYSNGDPKTVYADVTENNAKSIAYVAGKVKDSEKFSSYSSEQQNIIMNYIDGKEISK